MEAADGDDGGIIGIDFLTIVHSRGSSFPPLITVVGDSPLGGQYIEQRILTYYPIPDPCSTRCDSSISHVQAPALPKQHLTPSDFCTSTNALVNGQRNLKSLLRLVSRIREREKREPETHTPKERAVCPSTYLPNPPHNGKKSRPPVLKKPDTNGLSRRTRTRPGEKKRGGSVITDVFIIIAWEGLAERKRK